MKTITIAAVLFGAAQGVGQGPVIINPVQDPSILFTLTQPEQTASGSSGTSLGAIAPNEIAMQYPPPMFSPILPCVRPSAEKYAPLSAYNHMAGDADGDTVNWNVFLFDKIDAVMLKVSRSTAVNLRNTFFSPKNPIDPSIAGLPGLRPADVGVIVRRNGNDGQVEHFLRYEQVRDAFSISANFLELNVDAVAQDQAGNIFLSLEDDHVVDLPLPGPTITARDGAVLMIPAAAITYDPDGNVASVVPGSGIIALTESEVANMVLTSGVTDNTGNAAQQIIDLDALALDPKGGTFVSSWAVQHMPGDPALHVLPNLVFAGEALTGASLLTTAGFGSIWSDSCGPKGTSAGNGPTTGAQMGLQVPASGAVASSINGLELAYQSGPVSGGIARFALDTPVNRAPKGSTITVDIGGGPNGGIAHLAVGFAPRGSHHLASSLTSPFFPLNRCFPDYYPAALAHYIGPMTLDGSGFGSWTSAPIPVPVSLQFVAIYQNGAILEVSSPLTIEIF